MDKLLKFTFSVPTLNSGRYLQSCLESIINQEYPRESVEIIISDAGSEDNTLDIARKYTSLLFENKKKLGEYGTQIAAEKASGDLFVVFAADNGLVGTDWLKKVSGIFTNHKDLSCMWGKMIASKADPVIMRYYELIQSEPLAHFLNKNLEFYLKKAAAHQLLDLKYEIFNADPKKPLCWGANGIVYRLRDVKELFVGDKYIGDNEIFQYMVENGHTTVGYSSDLNIYHHTVSSVRHWVGKWRRNYTQIFLKTRHHRRIDWFYYGNFKLKMFLWLGYSLIPIFSISHTVYLMLRDGTIYWFYHPLMCFLQTWTYLYWTVALEEGRESLLEHIFRKNNNSL